jgi:hypothetical protein
LEKLLSGCLSISIRCRRYGLERKTELSTYFSSNYYYCKLYIKTWASSPQRRVVFKDEKCQALYYSTKLSTPRFIPHVCNRSKTATKSVRKKGALEATFLPTTIKKTLETSCLSSRTVPKTVATCLQDQFNKLLLPVCRNSPENRS